MMWEKRRRAPASLFTLSRAAAICSFVRNQSCGMSDGAEEMSAILVSLSRKISLTKFAYLRSSSVCSRSASAVFQPALPTAERMLTKLVRRVSSRRKCVCMSMMN